MNASLPPPARLLLLAGLTLFATACDTGSGPGGGIPIVISATWQDVQDPEHTITFRSPDDERTSGVVAGTEEHDDCVTRCPVGGSWRNGRLEIAIDRAGTTHRFSAQFHQPNPTELSFTSTTGAAPFTLEQP